MDTPKTGSEATQAGRASQPRKPLWETVLISTPVILTVIATLLAGLSSSEMNLAQYHRSLAAQNQSKAGDQWNFFQAKRLRGTSLEMTVELLRGLSEAGKMEPGLLGSAPDRLLVQLRRAEEETLRLKEAIKFAKNDLGPAAESLALETERLLQITKANIQEVERAKKEVKNTMARNEVSAALVFLNPGQLPKVKDQPLRDPVVGEAVQEIARRKTETETAPLMGKIKEESLQEAIRIAEANAKAFDDAAEPISKVFDQIALLVQNEVAQARSFQGAARDVQSALADVPGKETKASNDLKAAALALARTSAFIKSTADELNNDFQAARHDFTARRYKREAGYNQAAAGLYEIQVRKSSVTSDRHRARSKLFFYGMLTAQAGVIIASLSLAVRQKSVLWSLAGIAGIAAVLFSGYVYWYM